MDYAAGDSEANSVVTGAIVALLGLVLMTRSAVRALDMLTLVAGAWLIGGAFLVVESRSIQINLILMGGIVGLLALISLGAASERRRPGGL